MERYNLFITQSKYPRNGFSYTLGMAIGGDIHPPKTRQKLKVFYDEDEALEAFSKYESKLEIQ